LAEWYEPIVQFLKDWTLVIATIALAVCTFYLAKYTKAMAKQSEATQQLAQAQIKASEALAVLPTLTFNLPQPLSDGRGEYARFSVKNVGFGHAKNPQAKLTTGDGRQLEVRPWTKTNVIEKNDLFYWDIYGTHVGEEVTVEVSFTDIHDNPKPVFKHTWTII
jgi:hypothetical protein